jgi:hypothetical protein
MKKAAESKKEKVAKKETAAKTEKKSEPKTEAKEALSSMAFIRAQVTDDPAVTFENLVGMVQKAGYQTKTVSIKMEYRKTLKKLAASQPAA